MMELSAGVKKFIEDKIEDIEKGKFAELSKKLREENKHKNEVNARELFHFLYMSDIYDLFDFKLAKIETEHKNITVYINEAIKTIDLENLIDLMKKYHCYIDYRVDKKQGVKFCVFISNQLKEITDDSILQKYFDACSKELYKKATRENANPLDLFFLLAYHTIDRIEFKPKKEMTELVRESRNTENRTNNDDYKNDRFERDCPDSNAQNSPEFSIFERLGCYIDRSWKNVRLDANNHNIYLCKDYIEDYSKELEVLDPNFNYSRTLLLTFLHEFGHLAFSYLDYITPYEGEGKTTHESRANFLPSYVHDGKIDMYIEQFVASQPKSYQAPLLFTGDEWEKDLAIKKIYFQP